MKRSTSHAFTLIELLVIIGILVVLITMLVPALTRMKQYAYVAKCQANQAALFAGFAAYANEYGDYPSTGQRWVTEKNDNWVLDATYTKDSQGKLQSNYQWMVSDPNYRYDSNFSGDPQYDKGPLARAPYPSEYCGDFGFGGNPGAPGGSFNVPIEQYINNNYQMMQCPTMPVFSNLKPDGRHKFQGFGNKEFGRNGGSGDPNFPDLGMGFWYNYNGPNVTTHYGPQFDKDPSANISGYIGNTWGIAGCGAEDNRMERLACQGASEGVVGGYFGVSKKDGGRHICSPVNGYRNGCTSVADVAFFDCPALMAGSKGELGTQDLADHEPHLMQPVISSWPLGGGTASVWVDCVSNGVCRNYTFGDGHVVFINRPNASFGPSDHF